MSVPLERLIVVAGHAVWRDVPGADAGADEAWWMAEFQRGEGAVFEAQMRRGVERAAADPGALLVPSGGRTHADAPWSEAEGLLRLARARGWWGRDEVAARAAAEEHARDSLENLLFALAGFHGRTGRWPARVTVVTWPFKAERFGLHRRALGWPAEAFAVEGVGAPVREAEALAGEARTRAAFERDPLGRGPELAAKRAARDPGDAPPPYAAACPALAPLLAPEGAPGASAPEAFVPPWVSRSGDGPRSA